MEAWKAELAQAENLNLKLSLNSRLIFHLQKLLLLHRSSNSRANWGGSVVNYSIYRHQFKNTHTITNKKQKKQKKKGWESVIFPTRKAFFLFFPFSLFLSSIFSLFPFSLCKAYYLSVKFFTALPIWEILT